MEPMTRARTVLFYLLMLSPVGALFALGALLFFCTNVPQILYARSIRNIYFDCFRFVPEAFVYTLQPGICEVGNIEHASTFTSDANGFRNAARSSSAFRVAVLGDSQAHGFGVQDNETFAHLLEARHGYPTTNLAIGSYATLREVEAFAKHGATASYVVVQYCDNDASENEASLRLPSNELHAQVESSWKARAARYHEGKALGFYKPLRDFFPLAREGAFISKSAWRRKADWRDMEQEARSFAQILARYREVLEGKRVIVFEVATWGANSPRFAATFGGELAKLGWLQHRLIDFIVDPRGRATISSSTIISTGAATKSSRPRSPKKSGAGRPRGPSRFPSRLRFLNTPRPERMTDGAMRPQEYPEAGYLSGASRPIAPKSTLSRSGLARV